MFKTTAHVDWISFTAPCFNKPFKPGDGFPEFGEYAFLSMLGNVWTEMVGNVSDWILVGSRPPYTVAAQKDKMFTVYAGKKQAHVLMEISGKGCQRLRDLGLEQTLLTKVADRVTRIDIAHDWETQITPMAVVEEGHSEAFKTVTTIQSNSGETVYVGSPKSLRRCRIYRYSPPHPRSKILRFEYVFRKGAAKTIAKSFERMSMDKIVNSCIDTLKWKHSIFDFERELVKLPLARPERGSSNTLRWVLTQVAPAIRTLVAEQIIEDPERFFQTHFIP